MKYGVHAEISITFEFSLEIRDGSGHWMKRLYQFRIGVWNPSKISNSHTWIVFFSHFGAILVWNHWLSLWRFDWTKQSCKYTQWKRSVITSVSKLFRNIWWCKIIQRAMFQTHWDYFIFIAKIPIETLKWKADM